jgi:hypothetical protein
MEWKKGRDFIAFGSNLKFPAAIAAQYMIFYKYIQTKIKLNT